MRFIIALWYDCRPSFGAQTGHVDIARVMDAALTTLVAYNIRNAASHCSNPAFKLARHPTCF